MADIRTFISVPVPNTAGFAPLFRDLAGIRGVRTSPAAQMHITLKFLGDVPEESIPEVCSIVDDCTRGIRSSRITVRGIGACPSMRSPRTVWAGVETDIPLEMISERIAGMLDTAGIPYDPKPFKPHITVARTEGRADLSRIFANYRDAEFATFICSSVMVMKSELGPHGASHTVLGFSQLG